MKAKILVKVDRDTTLEAIRTLDALSSALQDHEPHWPKKLKRQYEKARQDLVRAAGLWAQSNGLAEIAAFD
jgi:hypothetical protein